MRIHAKTNFQCFFFFFFFFFCFVFVLIYCFKLLHFERTDANSSLEDFFSVFVSEFKLRRIFQYFFNCLWIIYLFILFIYLYLL